MKVACTVEFAVSRYLSVCSTCLAMYSGEKKKKKMYGNGWGRKKEKGKLENAVGRK